MKNIKESQELFERLIREAQEQPLNYFVRIKDKRITDDFRLGNYVAFEPTSEDLQKADFDDIFSQIRAEYIIKLTLMIYERKELLETHRDFVCDMLMIKGDKLGEYCKKNVGIYVYNPFNGSPKELTAETFRECQI